MKSNSFKNLVSLATLVTVTALSSCSDKNMDQYLPPEEGGNVVTYNSFDFSTTKSGINLMVSYAGCGLKTPVYFELYDENPIVENESGNGFTKKEDVKPLFTSYTGEDCIFNGTISLPSYVGKVWVFSPSFYAKTLMEAEVVGNSISVSDVTSTSSKIAAHASDEAGFSYMTRTDVPNEYKAGKRWKEWLGTYDSNGKIDYVYTGSELVPDASLYDIHSQIINANKLNCPSEYRNAADLEIRDAANVVVTFLGGNSCWNSSLGYYYYKVGEEPASMEDANVIMIFPNTQDGKWSKTTQESDMLKAGVDRMTSVKLKYYPNIAEGSQEGATDVFPGGYKVGLVLATNAWSKRLEYTQGSKSSEFNKNRYYRAATLSKLSVRQDGTSTDLPLVASYYAGNKQFIIASFEDDYKFANGLGYDSNFSDVVLAIGTNPVATVADLPVVGDKMNADGSGVVMLHETLQGTYLFEDLWPEKGDYDMNDACVEYTYGRAYDKWNDTYAETFSFKPRENYATKTNGIAFRLTGGERAEVKSNGAESGKTIQGYQKPAEVKLYIGGKEATSQLEYDEENQIYYVIPDTKKNTGVLYTVEFVHIPDGAPQNYERNYKKYQSTIDVFLYRKVGNKNWEVHTSGTAPSPMMDYQYFGTGDDLSNPEQGIYYVRSGNFPFALFLSGSDINKFEKLFDRNNESISLDKLYPKYGKWVESNGAENTDWYK